MAVAGNIFLSGVPGNWDNLGPEVLLKDWGSIEMGVHCGIARQYSN